LYLYYNTSLFSCQALFLFFFVGSWKLDFPLLLVFIAPLCGFRALAPMIIKDLSSLWVLFRGVSHVLTSLSFCIFIITDVLEFVKRFLKLFSDYFTPTINSLRSGSLCARRSNLPLTIIILSQTAEKVNHFLKVIFLTSGPGDS